MRKESGKRESWRDRPKIIALARDFYPFFRIPPEGFNQQYGEPPQNSNAIPTIPTN